MADDAPEEGEHEPTAEEIVSELEEDLSHEDEEDPDREDDGYLDHEPTVAELEAMIPRPPEEG